MVELGVPRLRIESILRNSLDTDEDADIIHHMLTSWVKRLPRAADKVNIFSALLLEMFYMFDDNYYVPSCFICFRD